VKRAPLWRRAAVTVGVPIALSVVGRSVALPGVDPSIVAAARAGGSFAAVGVLALGITPFLSAYWIVEVAAFLVPRWSTLRHGNPEGRARLERAVGVLGLVLAAMQGFGVASTLASVGGDALRISIPVVTITLVAGAFVELAAARFITRNGLVNGFIVLLAADVVRSLVGHAVDLAQMGGALGSVWLARSVARTVLAVTVIGIASWTALRGARAPAARSDANAEDGAPYRGARELAVRPWIPLPSSSFQPYFIAGSLLTIPVTLANWKLVDRDVVKVVQGGWAGPLQLLILLPVMVVMARALHRPAEMADLAQRLGAKTSEQAARVLLAGTYLPTFVFFMAVVFADELSAFGVGWVPILVAAAMDLHASWRARRAEPTLVPVWEERRASAAPVVEAVLAAEGIAAHAHGAAALSLLQVFAPYAPVEMWVKESDAPRAIKVLGHVFLGEEAGERAAAPALPAPREVAAPALWTLHRKTAINAVAAAVAGGALAFVRFVPETARGVTGGAPSPRAELEVARVDDSVDVFGNVADKDLPEGVAIAEETVPLGHAKTGLGHFARIAVRTGEPKQACVARLRRWVDTLPAVAGTRIGIAALYDHEPVTGASTFEGARTYVLMGEPALRTDDVVEAHAEPHLHGGASDVSVSTELSSAASSRLEAMTRAWMDRRIAILIDGEVQTAPVVKGALGGGRISITMAAGHGADVSANMADAERLARALHRD
jgi:hypothetical protein